MFRSLFAIALLWLCTSAHAQLDLNSVGKAGFDRLTPQQQAEVIKMVTEQSQKSPAEQLANRVTADDADKWLNIGERVGKMIGSAAREVGVAANEFVSTPVGMVAVAVIVWNYIGNDIAHLIGSFVLLVVGLLTAAVLCYKQTTTRITYHETKRTWWGAPVVVSKERSAWTNGQVESVVIVLGITAVAVSVSLFAM